MMDFSLNTLPHEILIAPLQKSVPDFIADVIFDRREAFYLNISTKNETTRDKNIDISSLK